MQILFELRNVIAHKLNIRVTQDTFDDLMLCYLATKNLHPKKRIIMNG